MKVLPTDQWGRIPGIMGEILGHHWSVIWSWPRGRTAWFLWGRYDAYRVGPVTFSWVKK